MMENVEKKEIEKNNEVKNEMPKKDDRMVVYSDGSVMSYHMARHPRFSENV